MTSDARKERSRHSEKTGANEMNAKRGKETMGFGKASQNPAIPKLSLIHGGIFRNEMVIAVKAFDCFSGSGVYDQQTGIGFRNAVGYI